ncbi:ribonuclease H-like superfamily protein [Striga asiatica]|uniref:Ribonuclease H-like superfamily protein n=1 Tax=Striga asiatica TaxID=4170 RepID=A0A5A7PNB2_STRAF|nr:ribonuclease H-like superfamily protein [Striga asiatica]
MCGGGKFWDAGLIRALFKQEDANEILKIKGLNPWAADVWSALAGRNTKVRLRIWRLQVLNKVKHFIWRSINNILPVKGNMSSRGLIWNIMHDGQLSVKELWWISSMPSDETSEDRIQLSTYILWWLWRARNLWVFEKKWQPKTWIIKAALRDWTEFKSRNEA